jgi:RNA polymerase sigma factor (sigma-70 family)
MALISSLLFRLQNRNETLDKKRRNSALVSHRPKIHPRGSQVLAISFKMAIIWENRQKMVGSTKKAAEIDKTIDRFTRVIRSAIRQTCPSIGKADMDDIEQEVRIAVWRQIEKNEKGIHNLGSYIWRVAYTTTSKVMKRLTEQRKELVDRWHDRPEADGAFRSPEDSGPDRQSQGRELLRIVRESVDGLIDSRRQVVKLYLSGMSADEITEYFGWSDGKARNLLSRGLADLREILREKRITLEE